MPSLSDGQKLAKQMRGYWCPKKMVELRQKYRDSCLDLENQLIGEVQESKQASWEEIFGPSWLLFLLVLSMKKNQNKGKY